MFTDSINISAVIPAKPKQVYQLWMTSKDHTMFASSYISGKTIELEPYSRIVQAWNTSDYPSKNSDSKLEVLLEEISEGTRVTLKHTGIPRGQGKGYRQGWIQYYLEPMRIFFMSQKKAAV